MCEISKEQIAHDLAILTLGKIANNNFSDLNPNNISNHNQQIINLKSTYKKLYDAFIYQINLSDD